ncbi:unnamed protein product [Ixodes hexagonus]
MDNITSRTESSGRVIVHVPRQEPCGTPGKNATCTRRFGSQRKTAPEAFVLPAGSNLSLKEEAPPPPRLGIPCPTAEAMPLDQIFQPPTSSCRNRRQECNAPQNDIADNTVRVIERCVWYEKETSSASESEPRPEPEIEQMTCPDCVLELIRREQRSSQMSVASQTPPAVKQETMVIAIPSSSQRRVGESSGGRAESTPGSLPITVIRAPAQERSSPGSESRICSSCGTCRKCGTQRQPATPPQQRW